MRNVGKILNIAHQFTPKGQEMLISTLKTNRALLKESFGFAKIPSLISSKGQTQAFNNELKSGCTIREIIIKELDDFAETLKSKIDNTKLMEYKNSINEALELNPRGKGAHLLTHHFEQKKSNLLEMLNKNKILFLPDKIKSKDLTNLGELNKEISNYDSMMFILSDMFSYKMILSMGISTLNKLKLIGTKTTQNLYSKLFKKSGRLYCDMQKILVSPSKDKRVRNIESKLKKKYGLDFVSLHNYEDAKKIQETFEIASKNNVSLPQNVIVTPYMHRFSQGNCIRSEKSIFINANNNVDLQIQAIKKSNIDENYKNMLISDFLKEDINNTSTNHPLHSILHEILHNEKQTTKSLPENFISVCKTIGDYVKNNFNLNNEEIRVELRCKQILEKLNNQEEEMLKILTK